MNTVHLIDNMEFMKDVPDKYYELAIVDPPYGDGGGGAREPRATQPQVCHAAGGHFAKYWGGAIQQLQIGQRRIAPVSEVALTSMRYLALMELGQANMEAI